MSSLSTILPEIFNAHFPVQTALSAGLVPVLFLQKSSMHNPGFGAPYQPVYSLSYFPRSLQCPFPCIESPNSRSIPLLFLPNSSMHILMYRAP